MTQSPLPGTDRQKCIKLTRDGSRCTRWAYSDTDMCRQHGKLVKARTPTGLSEQDQSILFDALKLGLGLDEAVIVAEVSRSTVYDWLARAKQADSAPEYAAFAAGVELARTHLERRTLGQMAKAADKGNVRAQIYLLEHVANPQRYRRRSGAGQMALGVDAPKRRVAAAADEGDVPDNVVPMRPAGGAGADW